MPQRTTLKLVSVLSIAVMMVSLQSAMAQWENQPAGSHVTPDPWPKIDKQDNATYTLYQPQLDSWDGYNFTAHAAVSVLPRGDTEPSFGVIEMTAKTHVFRVFRTVHLRDIAVTQATSPSAPGQAASYQQNLQTILTGGESTLFLDRRLSMLSIENALKLGRAVPVKNDPPVIVFSPRTAVLVSIDSD